MSLLRRLRERTGVRAASALAAAAAVAVVLVVAGISLVLVLEQTLKNNSRAALEEAAGQLGNRIEANFSGSGDPKRNAIDATGKRTDIVQVVTAYSDETNAPDWMVGSNGEQEDVQVIGSSDPLNEQGPVADWLLAPGETRSEVDVPITFRNGAGEDGADEMVTENMMVVGVGDRAQGRPITIYAAQELNPVHEAVRTVAWLVTGGVPILVLVAGFFTYLFAGRALRPVEEMRSQVAGMDEKDLTRRVPEPVARDEVGRLARTMNQMLGRIESSQATQRRFVADASHELRSPLATVSTGLELLGNGMSEGSADRATVETLRGETSRLTGLVEGLLFLARADERGLVPRREEVDLDEIVDAERARPAGGSDVTVRVGTEPVRVVGDRGQLVRVVRNLVDNAKRHAASTVAVSLRVADGSAVLDVDDDGNGVPDADRQRVFERFVRLDEARARGDGGSGLGLSIVAELVAAHGGTVEALESPELGGARFRVTLPADAAPEPDEDDRPDDPAADADPDAGAPGGTRPDAAPANELVPSAAGPGAAGPSAAGPSVVGPSAAASGVAGPGVAGPGAAGPNAAGSEAVRTDGVGRTAAAPDGPASTAARPTAARPAAAVPGGATTDGAVPNGAATDGAVPNGAATDGAATDGAVQNGAAQHAAPPNGAGSDGARPSDAAPNGAKPGSGGASPDPRADRDDTMRGPGAPGVTGTDGSAPDGAPLTPPAEPDPEDDVPAPQPYRRFDPPTGPVPIRPGTVGSPYDENATRPIPVHRGTPARPGAAVTAPQRTGRPDEPPARPAPGRQAPNGHPPRPRRSDGRRR
ncbi:Signal transduction histidine kinase [Pseudonocardia ammonioxydans]|uniref:histidine kinase n=1 Tax=Pseudonocardia ammonioxydans TaxID=260086 RepID=A0A1I4SM67_PSUAM|nr:ATP-binding protein [Pseudonocardia ammonioxydans]SFM65522.1 Signal transduction histidine kinase [Pseudonocardia ammonioxydans]